MNIAFKEVNQDGELILNDKYGDDVEITESGIVDCTEIKINKTTVLTPGRVLQNVTLGALPSLSVSSKPAAIFPPHVFGIFALNEFVILLPSISLEIV